MNVVDPLTNFDILHYVKVVGLPHFRGIYMRDTLPATGSRDKECGVMNFNLSTESGSHWVCYFRDGQRRIYFDSFGQITPIEMQKYLKTKQEFEEDRQVIQRNTDIVQELNTNVCGHLCLVVLTALSKEGKSFQEILNILNG